MGKNLSAIYFVSVFGGLSVFRTAQIGLKKLMMTISGKELDTNWVHGVAGKWAKGIFSWMPGWEITVEGQENIPKDSRPFVLVSNHGSGTDILVVYYLGLQFRWLSKKEVFKVPVLGQAMRWAGYVSVSRGERASYKQAMKESADWLGRGVPMFFFPEGSRSIDGDVKKFKMGAFKLAIDSNVSVLPISIEGSHKLIRKGTLTPGKAHVRVQILPEIIPSETEDAQSLADRTREIIVSSLSGSERGKKEVGRAGKTVGS